MSSAIELFDKLSSSNILYARLENLFLSTNEIQELDK